MNEALAASIYFGVQRLRGGVTREQVRTASSLLDERWATIEDYIRNRLTAVYGPSACERDWLISRPLVDRTELIARMEAHRASAHQTRIEHRKTSGSTGTPFHFVKDVEMTAWMDAAMWAAYGWHGIEPGDRQARFWGTPQSAPAAAKRRLIDWVQNRRRFGAFQVDALTSVTFLEAMIKFGPRYAYGYPTLIDEFVKQCAAQGRNGRALRLRLVICTGELLLPVVRERIAAFFGCPVVNEYGCSESGVLAMECEYGTMHVVPVAACAEVVGATGETLPPGEAGEVVVTDLYGRLEPLVRYRLHDRASAPEFVSCACGRHLPQISVDEGRIGSFIATPDGRRIYAAILAYTVPPEVHRFRARQTDLGRLEVDVVAGNGFDAAQTPAECERRWKEALGAGMEVVVTQVPEIPTSTSGKLRYFVPLAAGRAERTE